MITVRMVSSEHCSNPARRRLKNATSTERRLKNATVMHDIQKAFNPNLSNAFFCYQLTCRDKRKQKQKLYCICPRPATSPKRPRENGLCPMWPVSCLQRGNSVSRFTASFVSSVVVRWRFFNSSPHIPLLAKKRKRQLRLV